MAAGDFNGDGIQDLAVANYGSNNVTVLIGTGTGTFSPAANSPISTGISGAIYLAVADFNGDGIDDIAVANNASSSVAVLLGSVSGVFTQPVGSPFSVGGGPLSLAVADFNGDGFPDLAASIYGTNSVTVLLGTGTGVFNQAGGSPFSLGSGSDTVDLVTADFNNDGMADLAVTNFTPGNVTVFLGSNVATTPVLTTTSPLTIAYGASVPLSLAVSGASVGFQPLQGAGIFEDGTTPVGVAAQIASPFTLNLNGLAVGSHPLVGVFAPTVSGYLPSTSSAVTITVTQASQAITFGSLSNVTFGVSPFSISATASSTLAVSFTSNTSPVCTVSSTTVTIVAGGTCSITASQPGNSNVAAATPVTQTFTVFIPQTITMSEVPTNQLFGGSPLPISAKSTSGLPVSLASNTTAVCGYSGGLVTLLKTGLCSIEATQAGNATYNPATPATRTIVVSHANPSGTLTAASGSPFAVGSGANPYGVAIGDFNEDGVPDFAVAIVNNGVGNVTLVLSNGSGGYTVGSPTSVSGTPETLAVGDFNADGHQDLALASSNFSGSLTVLLGNGTGGFTAGTGSPIAIGANPAAVAVGDFNGDGIQDIVIANSGGDSVTVLLGNGSGGFTAATGSPFATGSSPASVAVADFDGDGKLDIATANFNSNNVTVLRGNGLGGFTPAPGSPFAAGTEPGWVAVGDFNADGFPDLAVSNTASSNVTVLLGIGSGAFNQASGSPFAVGNGPVSVAVGDFNGDGIPDLATANSGGSNVSVLLGNGTGGFATAGGSPFRVGTNPNSIAVGDFNGDGLMDLVTANVNSANISVLTGGVAATTSVLSTTSPLTIAFGAAVPLNLAISDTGTAFNAPTGTATFLDGGASLGTASQNGSPYTFNASSLGLGSHSLTVNYGGGSGSAASASNTLTVQVNQASQSISFGTLSDVNFGAAPFTVSATATSSLTVTFALEFAVHLHSQYRDSDCTCYRRMLDYCKPGGNTNYGAASPVTQTFTVNPASQSITFDVIRNKILGASPFPIAAQSSSLLPVTFTSSTPSVCTTASVLVTLLSAGTCTVHATQGGNASYSAATPRTVGFSVTQALPTGTLSAATGSPFTAGNGPFLVATGDFDGNGVQDLAIVDTGSNNIAILLGNGSGGFTAATGSPFAVGAGPSFVGVGDFNGDGSQDLAVSNYNDSTLTVLLGNGSGGFTPATGSPFAVGSNPRSVAVGDFNGDGIQDIATANSGSNNVTVLLGNGSGGFAAAPGSPFATGTTPFSVAVGDFDGDGKPDLVTANDGSSNVTILLGNGAGGFTQATGSPFAVGTGPLYVTVGDFDRNGKQDLATANEVDNTVTVLLGDGSGGFTEASGSPFATGTAPRSVIVGDFNGDGIPDLATSNVTSDNVSVLLGNGTGGFSAAAGSPFSVGSAPSLL